MSFAVVLRRLVPALFSLGALYAQGELATITGEVTDSAQSIMPGVNITIRNVDTNIKRTIETNAEGYFTVTNLSPGSYELIAEKQGFRAYHETGIVLATGQELRSDIKLSVGAVTESVNVTAEAAPLNTENGMIKGAVITQAEVSDMPLNGRDFTELALFVPGVVVTAQGGAGSFAINGARGETTNYLLDGVDDRNVRGAAAQLRPNIDALQEFKMETSGFSAEYGKMAGGIMNMVLKQGANAYHGTLFEYLRNDFFDSKAYFDTAVLPFKQNQFGGVISGPLSIPKVYNGRDRTFFMFSWESNRNPYQVTYLGTVPTVAEKAGDFSKDVSNTGKPIVISDPANAPTYVPFPGNIIPSSRISPIAQAIMQFYPAPNRTAVGTNLLSIGRWHPSVDSLITRGDHRFSEKDSVSVTYGKRFNRTNQPNENNVLGQTLALFDPPIRDDRELGGISYTHMFRPTLLSETRFGLSRNATRDTMPSNFPTAAQLGMAGSTTGYPGFPPAFPLVNVTNYLPVGFTANEPIQYYVTNFGVRETMTWIKGDHVFKWGVDVSKNRFIQPFFNNAHGSMTASGIWSGARTATNGDAVADLELGLLASSSITTQVAHNYMHNLETAFFFTDDWKVSHTLTLNLGLRYEIDGPPYDVYGRMTNFIPEFGQVAVANPANVPNYAQSLAANPATANLIVPASQLHLPQSLIYTNYKGYAPRVGFAWRPFGSQKTILRGGYGIFYSGELLNDVRNALDNVFPVVIAPSFSNVATNPNALTLPSPWPGGLATLATSANGYQLRPGNPYLQSYNLTVEREIGRGLVFEGAFVGSKGTNLGVQSNINTPYRTLQYQQFGVFPSPYPAFGAINYWSFNTNSIYNAGQFLIRSRSASGLTYRISYTYSKSIDIESNFTPPGVNASLAGVVEDPRNLNLSRGRSDFDRGHIVQAVFSYELPVGRNAKFLSGAGPVVNGFFGGWRLAGTAIFETGSPMTIEDSSVNTAIGQNLYPNRIANGANTSGSGRRGIDYPWFNPADFIPVPGCVSRTNCAPDQYGFVPFADGNAGRNILDAPGLANINLSLQKNWSVGERKTVQLRWEVFNIFNHPNFVLMDRNSNETAAGYLTTVAAVGNGGSRIMQFGLKFMF